MPITTSTPVAIINPEIPYDRLGIQLAIAPIFKESDVEGTMALRVIPYRVLVDGKIDKREDLAKSISVADIFTESQTDPAFASAMAQIWTAIQGYIIAKGL